MASNNNPTTPAAATQPAAPEAPAANTQVQVGGQAYELRDISVDRGLQLYNALPAENKAEADRIAYVVKTFFKVQKAASKYNIDPTELAQNWLKAGNDIAAQNALPPEQQKAIKELSDSGMKFSDLTHMIPGADFASGAATITGAATGATGAAIDGTVNGASRVWGALSVMGTEAWGHIFGYGGGSPDNAAKVFAAATVALRMDATDKRHAQGMMTQLWNNPLQYAGAALGTIGDWIAQHIPGAEYVIAAFKWMGFTGPNKPTYSQFVEQAKAGIEESKQKNPTDFAHLGENFRHHTDVSMYDREGDHVRESLEAASTIAGMPTKGLATAVTATTVTYRGRDGVDTTLDHGNVGQQVTPGQRIDNAIHTVTGDGTPLEQGVRVAATAGSVGLAANAVRGVAEGVAGHHINTPQKAADKATKAADRLEKKLATAEARGPKEHAWEVHKTSPAKQEAMRADADALRVKAETAAAKAAVRKAGTGEFIATATTPLKEINGDMHLPDMLGGGKLPKWLATTINAPRGLGRVAGHTAGVVFEGTKNFVFGVLPGARDAAVGFGKGIDEVVNSKTGQQVATALEATGRVSGRFAAHAIKIFDPAIEGARTVSDIGRGDTAGWASHGAATAAMGGAIVKLGAREAVPVMAPIMDTGEFVYSAAHKDTGGMIRSGTSLGTTAAGAAIGAGIGVWFFGVGAVPGAAIGATVGGIAGLVTGPVAQHFFTPKEKAAAAPAPAPAPKPAPAAPAPQAAALTHAELAASHQGVIEQARMAMGGMASELEKLTGFNLGMKGHSVTVAMGSTVTPGSNGSVQTAAKQQHVANA